MLLHIGVFLVDCPVGIDLVEVAQHGGHILLHGGAQVACIGEKQTSVP